MSQTCSEDGMEFTLKTPEGFLGRIYPHGFYDRCYQRGNGGLVNVLRISGAQGYPDCGTIRVRIYVLEVDMYLLIKVSAGLLMGMG